jgi:2'-5' RNA ligase
MLYLDVPIWSKITSKIKESDTYNKPGYGIEKEPHLTILYGFHDDVDSSEVFELYEKNFELNPIEVKISGISVFENSEFDVVKFDVVKSDLLVKANKLMKELPNTSNFPEYHPHITIAYVESGKGKKYVKSFDKDRILSGDELVYTWKGHNGKSGGKTLKLNKDNINENKQSKYGETKESLMKSKSLSKEMKEKILQYLGGGSTYHEGGRVHGLIKPNGFTDKTPKSSGVSLGADKDGFYCYTHRAASERYESPEKIPIKDIKFIESTG